MLVPVPILSMDRQRTAPGKGQGRAYQRVLLSPCSMACTCNVLLAGSLTSFCSACVSSHQSPLSHKPHTSIMGAQSVLASQQITCPSKEADHTCCESV